MGLERFFMRLSTGTSMFLLKGGKFLTEFLLLMSVWNDIKEGILKELWSKLDLEKAYDRIDWNFLDCILERKGFGAKW